MGATPSSSAANSGGVRTVEYEAADGDEGDERLARHDVVMGAVGDSSSDTFVGRRIDVAPAPFREALGAVNILEGGVARVELHGGVGGCCYFRPGAYAADPSPTIARRPNLNTGGSAGMTF